MFGGLFSSDTKYEDIIKNTTNNPNNEYLVTTNNTEHEYLIRSIFSNKDLTLLYYVYLQVANEKAKDPDSPQSKIIELLDRVRFNPYTFLEKEVLVTFCNEVENRKELQYGVLFWENIVNFYYKALLTENRPLTVQEYVFREVSSRRIISNLNNVIIPSFKDLYDNDISKLEYILKDNPWLAALYIVTQALTVFFNQGV
jgi:hypothetical protein